MLGSGIVALLLLAGALGSLTLAPGRSFSLDFSWLTRVETAQGEIRAEWLFVALRLLILISFVLTPIALIMALLDRRLRQQVLRGMATLGLLFLGVWALQQLGRPPLAEREQPTEAVSIVEDDALPVDTFTEPSGLVVWSVSVGVALLLLAAVGAVLWMAWRRGQEERLPLTRLAQEAEIALEALRDGSDLRSVIIRCYAEMERVVARTRGLQRQDAMTAREFEGQLRRLGLPERPVADLVELFEAARYGLHEPAKAEENQAVESLSAIVAACRGTA